MRLLEQGPRSDNDATDDNFLRLVLESWVEEREKDDLLKQALVTVGAEIGRIKADEDNSEGLKSEITNEIYAIGPHAAWCGLSYLLFLKPLLQKAESLEAQQDILNRISATQVIIENLIDMFSRRELYTLTLTYPYGKNKKCALELAIEADWHEFFSFPLVYRCVDAIKRGQIYRASETTILYGRFSSLEAYLLGKEGPRTDDEDFPKWTGSLLVVLLDPRTALGGMPASVHDRLVRLPTFLFVLEVVSWIAFTTLFTIRVTLRNSSWMPLDWLLWFFSVAILVRVFQHIAASGGSRIHSGTITDTLDTCLVAILAVALAVRTYFDYFTSDSVGLAWAYDVMACDAVLVYMRLLVLVNRSRQFGLMMEALGRMLTGMASFVFLIVAILVSFAVTLTELCMSDIGGSSSDVSLWSIMYLLFRTLFYDYDFDAMQECHPYLAVPVYSIYLVVGVVVLLNAVLIAILTSVYENVQENATQEFIYARAVETLSYFLHVDRALLVAPVNLIVYILLYPCVLPCLRTAHRRHSYVLVMFRYLISNPLYTVFLLLSLLFAILTWPFNLLSLLLSPLVHLAFRTPPKTFFSFLILKPQEYHFQTVAWALTAPLAALCTVVLNLCFYVLYIPLLLRDIYRALRPRPARSDSDPDPSASPYDHLPSGSSDDVLEDEELRQYGLSKPKVARSVSSRAGPGMAKQPPTPKGGVEPKKQPVEAGEGSAKRSAEGSGEGAGGSRDDDTSAFLREALAQIRVDVERQMNESIARLLAGRHV